MATPSSHQQIPLPIAKRLPEKKNCITKIVPRLCTGSAHLRYPEFVAEAPQNIDAGLCSRCRHARRIESDRGSVFIMCQFSTVDPNFPKYPRLPVISCVAYSPANEISPTATP
jgi:hypothetical protein